MRFRASLWSRFVSCTGGDSARDQRKTSARLRGRKGHRGDRGVWGFLRRHHIDSRSRQHRRPGPVHVGNTEIHARRPAPLRAARAHDVERRATDAPRARRPLRTLRLRRALRHRPRGPARRSCPRGGRLLDLAGLHRRGKGGGGARPCRIRLARDPGPRALGQPRGSGSLRTRTRSRSRSLRPRRRGHPGSARGREAPGRGSHRGPPVFRRRLDSAPGDAANLARARDLPGPDPSLRALQPQRGLRLFLTPFALERRLGLPIAA